MKVYIVYVEDLPQRSDIFQVFNDESAAIDCAKALGSYYAIYEVSQ